MNLRIVRALLWEQFRKTYVLWLCAFGISLLGCLMTVVVVQMEASAAAGDSMKTLDLLRAMDDASGVIWYCLWLALVLYVASVLSIQNGMGELQLLIPIHQLRRPVSTFVLVLCRYFYDVFSTGLLVLSSWFLYELALPREVTKDLYLWHILLGTLAITACVRTLAWIFGGLGIPTVILLGPSIYAVLLMAPHDFTDWLSGLGAFPLTVTVVVVFLGLALSWMAVARQRSGRHLSWAPLWRLIDARSVRLQKQVLPFTTPHAAMLWFERRRQAYIYPGAIYLLFLAYFGPLALYVAHQEFGGLQLDPASYRAVQGDALLLGFLSSIASGTLIAGGLFAFMNQRTYVKSASRFLYLRPITTMGIARARLQSAGMRVLIALLPFLIFGLIVHEMDQWSSEKTLLDGLLPQFGMLGTLLLLALAFLGVAGAAWSGLWLGNVLFVAWMYVVSLFVAQQVFIYTFEQMAFVLVSCGGFCALVLALMVNRCWKRGLMSRKDIGQLLLAGFLLVLAYWTLGNIESLESGRWARQDWTLSEETHIGMAIMGLMVALSLAPRLTVPLIMDWARHR